MGAKNELAGLFSLLQSKQTKDAIHNFAASRSIDWKFSPSRYYAGPLWTKRGNPRKPTLVKVYVCIFVCLSTKAVHIEISSDLTTEAFLAALTRFVARRGVPKTILSDNGTNDQ